MAMKRLMILAIATLMLSGTACAREINEPLQPFSEWLKEFMEDARSEGISQETLDEAFDGTEPIERVLELDRKQPESRLTLQQYLSNAVSDKRIREGKQFYAENRKLLAKIGAEYGVQPRFIVALWGIETNYGRNTGGFRTVDALATLAYDGRRSEFFRDELIKALKILESEHMPGDDMFGSWAGALGQCQFMPSSFLQFAVDYNKDGRRDIWETKADVFASIANYLKSSGWNDSETWGRPVSLPDGFDESLADIKSEKPLKEWKKLGVRNVNGKPLPGGDINASVIFVGEGDDAAPYIIYGNYKVLLKWNRSRFFATAVSNLADAIGK